jgi:hypothetical protein
VSEVDLCLGRETAAVTLVEGHFHDRKCVWKVPQRYEPIVVRTAIDGTEPWALVLIHPNDNSACC